MSVDVVGRASVSEGWLGVCDALLEHPDHAANHVLIRMSAPLPEDAAARMAADDFLASVADCQEINEVRNTIFPAELAVDFDDPGRLTDAYLEDYDFLRKLGAGSSGGTYFGRICAYPRAGGGVGRQLEHTVEKLSKAQKGVRRKARYELNIYTEHKDRNKLLGFPCMTHLAFHVVGDQLDCLSIYRNHDVIRKGYGNYLGLAELQSYVAAASGFRPGELAVLAGRAYLELTKAERERLRALITAHGT